MSVQDKKKILIVDDEPSVRESLQLLLSRLYTAEAVGSGDEALEMLREHGSEQAHTGAERFPDLVILDVMMPGLDGLALLEKLRAAYPSLPVVMLTASKTVPTVVQAMKIGAIDYLNKPFDVDELLSLVEETLASGGSGQMSATNVHTFELRRQNVPLLQGDFGTLVGSHPVMRDLYQKVNQLAKRDTTILITGESGTGKELIAQEIHRRSKRADGPFIAINCAAIPESLIESELFGHEKGAFTHAIEKRIGHFELADKGTLLLDEIGELSLPVQVKMLRVLQEQEFYRIGRHKPIQVDVRILAATNRNLENAILEGRFRQDLFYRINVVALELPPLRARAEDIPGLIQHFVAKLSPLYGHKTTVIADNALEVLCSYTWPGNVRELENVVESILALSSSELVEAKDLPARLRTACAASAELKQDPDDGELAFEEAERVFETDIIMKALRKTNFVQTRAAELLGISRRILKYKMDKLGIRETPEQER